MKNRIYILLGIIWLVAFIGIWISKPVEAYPSSENLVLCLDMDDNTGTADVADSSAENCTCTFFDAGGNPNTDAHSKVSLHQRALDFDGTDDYIALDMFYDTAGEISEITISAWVKIPAGGGNWSIVDFDRSEYYTCAAGIPSDAAEGLGDYVGWHTTNSSGGIDDMWSTGTVRDDTWHFITWVYDGDEVYDKKIYINGSLDSEKNAETTGVNLGRGVTRYGIIGDGSEATTFNGGRNDIWFEGTIDNVRIYNRALLIEEIALNYWLGSETRLRNVILQNCDLR